MVVLSLLFFQCLIELGVVGNLLQFPFPADEDVVYLIAPLPVPRLQFYCLNLEVHVGSGQVRDPLLG